MPLTPDALRAALAALPVRIDGVSTAAAAAPIPSYGGVRPSSIVRLAGAGQVGQGEHVGWTGDAHAAFRAAAPRIVPRGARRVAEVAAAVGMAAAHPYDRAAIEAATIDLALRQAGTTLLALAGTSRRPVRYVVSFARTADPAAEAARHPGVALKVDVDPGWSEAVWRALGASGRVAILDWKGTGDAGAYARAAAACPAVLHEDPAPPLPPSIAGRRSLDASLTEPRALDAIRDAPAAVNLKPARMGGTLAVLDTAARAMARGIRVYVGGMFEIGVGRRVLVALATVLSPDGPNDVAPIPCDPGPVVWPPALYADA